MRRALLADQPHQVAHRTRRVRLDRAAGLVEPFGVRGADAHQPGEPQVPVTRDQLGLAPVDPLAERAEGYLLAKSGGIEPDAEALEGDEAPAGPS